MATGCLVLVVGPSGAGKDTLIAGARAALGADRRFVFPERLVTRAAVPEAERHGTIDRAGFDRLRVDGAATLCWEAHGLGYVIPIAAAEAVAEGRIAVCNASRAVVAEALWRYPGARVVVVDARADIRAARLAARGRESAADIAARLARAAPEVNQLAFATVVDNSGPVADGVAAFVAALQTIAAGTDGTRRRA